MSLFASPLLMTNLACEMLFVLHQRLHAQGVSQEKSQRVLRDILYGFLDPAFLEELFTPQLLCSFSAAKKIFQQLAHVSVMKLNDASMSKLFDLMVMVCKYHTLHCAKPAQLMEVTMRHLEEVEVVTERRETAKIDGLRTRLRETYCDFTEWRWYSLWSTLVEYFREKKVKVSVLLQLGVQQTNGRIVLPEISDAEFQRIGRVVRYNQKGEQIAERQIELPSSLKEKSRERAKPDKALGTNLYGRKPPARKCEPQEGDASGANVPPPVVKDQDACEVRLLSSLLKVDQRPTGEALILDLDLEEEEAEFADATPVIPVGDSGNNSYKRSISRIAQDLDDVDTEQQTQPAFEDALLALLQDM